MNLYYPCSILQPSRPNLNSVSSFPARPRENFDQRATRMSQEEKGWASVDDLPAQIQKDNPRISEQVLRPLAQYGSKRRGDGRIVWKRDPAIGKGFVPTELWRIVRQIKEPIIYILGGAITIVPAETQEQLRQALPQVQIVTMPGLGHYPGDKKPEDFLAIMDGFLAGTKAGKKPSANWVRVHMLIEWIC